MDATSFYVPRVPPAAPGDSPRSAGWSDPGTCQDYCFCSGSRSVRFCVHPFKSEDYFPQPSRTPQIKPCCPSKPNAPGACLPGAGPLGWGAQYGAQNSHYSGRTSAIVIILHFVCCPPQGMTLYWESAPPTLLVVILLYVFSCRRSFLVGSGLFHRWLFCR